MVIKTDVCFFSELKIWPGHGKRFVRKDGRLLAFVDQKSRSLYTQRKKNQKLTWTQAWRRLHKKGKQEDQAKRKVRKAGRVFKSIQGLSLEDIKNKRTQKPEVRKAAKDAAIREVKERKKKAEKAEKSSKTDKKAFAAQGQKSFVKVPKSRRVLATSR